MISSHSWEVVASGKDDYAAVDPRMNSLDVAEHEDLKRWENDYWQNYVDMIFKWELDHLLLSWHNSFTLTEENKSRI